MSYFKKGHSHKPKKGKGSYSREQMSLEDFAVAKKALDEQEINPIYAVVWDEEMSRFLMHKFPSDKDPVTLEELVGPRIAKNLKKPWPDEPCDILGPSVDKDDSPWQEKYKGKTRSCDNAMHRM